MQRGLAAARAGDFAHALAALREAAKTAQTPAPVHMHMGSCHAALGDHDSAIEAYRTALTFDPSLAAAWAYLGSSLLVRGDVATARDAFGRAIALDPDSIEAHEQMARLRFRLGDLAAAMEHQSRVIRLEPGNSEALSFLGTILLQMRADRQAAQAFALAIARDSANDPARAQLMFLLAKAADWPALRPHRERLGTLGLGRRPVSPFLMIPFDDEPVRQRRRAEAYADAAYGGISAMPPPVRAPARPKRLKIGYFSADFRDHATMHLAARLFELHDRERFEIFAYSYGRDDESAMRRRAIAGVDSFHDVRAMLPAEIATLARNDGIDIAVDLKGYTGQQRLEIFASRAAPVQMSYLGYPGTTGARFIDYLIADSTIVNKAGRAGISEALIRLPDSYQINDDRRPKPSGNARRADVGLPDHAFVFASFNAAYKISADELEVWAELLRKVDGSVLWLLDSGPEARARLRAEVAARGVDPARLIDAPMRPYRDHLERVGLADLILDSFCCNAHTTASDALWCGVPIVTMPGQAFPARVAASLARAAGVDDFVASDREDFVRVALAYACDPDRQRRVRQKLLRRDSRLFDSAATTRAIERAYDAAFDRYLAGEPACDIDV